MSKKKNAEKRRKENLKDFLIALVVALFFIILGIIGIINSNKNYKEYSNSTDIREVEGKVTSVERKEKEYGEDVYTTKEDYWDAKMEVEIEDTVYEVEKVYGTEVKVGDTKTIEVYKKSDGTYDIPESTNETNLFLTKILYYISIAVGTVILLGGIFLCVDSEPKKKQNKG